jgi:hypothetical protein
MSGDRRSDGGGKAIAQEKSFNQSQHSIYCAIEAYYCSLRIMFPTSRGRQPVTPAPAAFFRLLHWSYVFYSIPFNIV